MVSISPHEDAARSQRLASVCREFAGRLEAAGAPAALAAELRRLAEAAAGVVRQDGLTPAEDRLRLWTRAALPVAEWLRGAARQQWADLRDACRAQLSRPGAERHRGLRFFARARETEINAGTAGLLQRCHDALDALVRAAPGEGVEALLEDLAAAAALPRHWPPLVLARLAADLGPSGETLLKRLADEAAKGASAADLSEDDMARLVLVRMTAEAASALDEVEQRHALAGALLGLLKGYGPATEPRGPEPFASPAAAPPNRWAGLPSPPAFDTDGGQRCSPPARWHTLSSSADAAGVERARDEFQSWLASEGGEWFDRVARGTAAGETAARAWLAALVEEKWCRCFPDPTAGGTTAWPADQAFPGGVNWEFDPAAPGTVLHVARYAETPEAARLTLSQGPRGANPALDAADDALVAAGAVGNEALTTAAQSLLDRTRRALLSGEREDVANRLEEVLDALVPASAASRTQSAALEEMLGALRAWAAAHELEVLPRRWSFVSPPTRDLLSPEELVGASHVFRRNDPKGSVCRVRAFGLARKEREILRPCVVILSAGPAPAGLAELEAMVKAPAHPAEEQLQQRLRGWCEAALEGTLDVVAVQLFVDF